MNIEEAKNFRLRESDGVQDRAGFESAIFTEFDHHLHAERPLARFVARRAFRNCASILRPTAPTGPSPTTVSAACKSMPGRETGFRISLQIGALIGEPHACNRVYCGAFNQRFRDRHARPDLHHAGRCNLIADPLIELAKRQHEAIVFSHERRRVGEFERIVLDPEQKTKRAQHAVGSLECK